jgi:hypothetical protein
VTTDRLTYTPTQFEIIRAVYIIYNTAADIIIKGFDPRTKRLPKTKKIVKFYTEKTISLYEKLFSKSRRTSRPGMSSSSIFFYKIKNQSGAFPNISSL